MSRGRVMQLGTPDALFEKPAHTFVGHFIGSPGMNFCPRWWMAPRCRWRASAGLARPQPARRRFAGGVRPEYLALSARKPAGAL